MRLGIFVSTLVGLVLGCFYLPLTVDAQAFKFTRDDLIRFTPEWKGERFSDGRPKVPDDIVKRMEMVAIEEAWSVLRGAGYEIQFEDGWEQLHPNEALVGRAVTVSYMPIRKEVHKVIMDEGHKNGRVGGHVSWPIDTLVKGDVYVADVSGVESGAPIIGSNLATSIYAKSGNGVVFEGMSRDLEGLESIKGFQAFVRGWHPDYGWGTMIMGINTPIRIGKVTVMPGDIVLAKRTGVIFIPPHLAENVVKTAERIRLVDLFGFQRLREEKYSPGQIDGSWTDEMERDFTQWMETNIDELPVPKERIQEILKERSE